MSEWTGEGLPPVGVWCEAVWECDGKVEMICPIFISDYTVVFEDKSGYERHADLQNILTFRTIKSEAERKRDEAVADIAEIIDCIKTHHAAELVYDAGYRKVNELTDEQIHDWAEKHYIRGEINYHAFAFGCMEARDFMMGGE